MLHFGDIQKIDGHKVPLVDVIVGGSPCQDLSVAGLRKGLLHSDKGDDETTRSGLFMEQIRIIKEMRDESAKQLRMRGAIVDRRRIQPRFMVWENVPGAFSSNKGEDFRAVLEETCRIADKTAVIPLPQKWSSSGCIMGDGWSVAWRVHDAQFWGKTIRNSDTGDVLKLGTPQRRRRIALVADFGGASAPEILFERESVSGDSEESREQRQGITEAASDSTDETICLQGNGIDRADTAGCNGAGWRRGGAIPSTQSTGPLSSISFQERAGKPGGGKGILIQNEHTGALSTLNNQALLAYSQDAYDKYTETDKSASIKQSGGNYGGVRNRL